MTDPVAIALAVAALFTAVGSLLVGAGSALAAVRSVRRTEATAMQTAEIVRTVRAERPHRNMMLR